MLYGEEKVLEMTRTALRSSARKSAHEALASIKRGHRRKLNTHLREFRGATEVEAEDEWDEGDFRPDTYPQARNDLSNSGGWWSDTIAAAMWERRDADHLSSFVRWGVEITKHIDDPEERYNYVKRLMPDTLAGRHALSHLTFAIGYDPDYPVRDYGWVRERRERERQERREFCDRVASIVDEYGLRKEVKRLFWRYGLLVPPDLADWLYSQAGEGPRRWERDYEAKKARFERNATLQDELVALAMGTEASWR